MTHEGNLIITNENAAQYEHITKVTGRLYVRDGATLNAPALTKVTGWLDVYEGATLTAPKLKR